MHAQGLPGTDKIQCEVPTDLNKTAAEALAVHGHGVLCCFAVLPGTTAQQAALSWLHSNRVNTLAIVAHRRNRNVCVSGMQLQYRKISATVTRGKRQA